MWCLDKVPLSGCMNRTEHNTEALRNRLKETKLWFKNKTEENYILIQISWSCVYVTIQINQCLEDTDTFNTFIEINH